MEDVKGLAIIGGALALSALITWGLARLAGRRIARTRPRLASALCMGAVPAAFIIHGYVTFRIEIAAHPTSDWPAMAMVSGMMFAGIALLASVPVTTLTLGGPRVRP